MIVYVAYIDYAGNKAFVIQWAFFFFSAVTFVLRCNVVVVNNDFLVVVVNNAAHVQHTAVTHFHVVLVKVLLLRKFSIFFSGFSHVNFTFRP